MSEINRAGASKEASETKKVKISLWVDSDVLSFKRLSDA